MGISQIQYNNMSDFQISQEIGMTRAGVNKVKNRALDKIFRKIVSEHKNWYVAFLIFYEMFTKLGMCMEPDECIEILPKTIQVKIGNDILEI